MVYKIHTGILFQEICGRSFLIALRPAREDCPPIQEINDYGAFCWKYLEQGLDTEDILAAIAKEYKVHKKDALEGLTAFIDQLEMRHFLFPVKKS